LYNEDTSDDYDFYPDLYNEDTSDDYSNYGKNTVKKVSKKNYLVSNSSAFER
jgi:hypothetical protein